MSYIVKPSTRASPFDKLVMKQQAKKREDAKKPAFLDDSVFCGEDTMSGCANPSGRSRHPPKELPNSRLSKRKAESRVPVITEDDSSLENVAVSGDSSNHQSEKMKLKDGVKKRKVSSVNPPSSNDPKQSGSATIEIEQDLTLRFDQDLDDTTTGIPGLRQTQPSSLSKAAIFIKPPQPDNLSKMQRIVSSIIASFKSEDNSEINQKEVNDKEKSSVNESTQHCNYETKGKLQNGDVRRSKRISSAMPKARDRFNSIVDGSKTQRNSKTPNKNGTTMTSTMLSIPPNCDTISAPLEFCHDKLARNCSTVSPQSSATPKIFLGNHHDNVSIWDDDDDFKVPRQVKSSIATANQSRKSKEIESNTESEGKKGFSVAAMTYSNWMKKSRVSSGWYVSNPSPSIQDDTLTKRHPLVDSKLQLFSAATSNAGPVSNPQVKNSHDGLQSEITAQLRTSMGLSSRKIENGKPKLGSVSRLHQSKSPSPCDTGKQTDVAIHSEAGYDEMSGDDEANDEVFDESGDEDMIENVDKQCPKCHFTSTSKQLIKNHAWTEHKLQLVPCHQCDGLLQECITRHHGRYHGVNKCPYCQRRFKRGDKMLDHINQTHNTIPCSIQCSEIVPIIKGKEYIQQQMFLAGLPKHDTIIMKEEFAVAYNKEKMHPLWAFEVFGNEVNQGVEKNIKPQFHNEPELGDNQITFQAIRYCEQHNGHLAAAGNHHNSKTAHMETYSMCNVVPMDQFVNRGTFRSLEVHTRSLATKGRKVFVVTGPVYSETSSSWYAAGGLNVLIPDAFFKVIVVQCGIKCYRQCFLIPNKRPEKPTSFHYYSTTPEKIHDVTGFPIFYKLKLKDVAIPKNAAKYAPWVEYIPPIKNHQQTQAASEHGSTIESEDDSHKNLNTNSQKKEVDVIIKCTNCQFASKSKQQVIDHAWTTHQIKLFSCYHCKGRLFKNISTHHSAEHGNNICYYCKKIFTTLTNMRFHVRNIHRGDIGRFVSSEPPESIPFVKGKEYIQQQMDLVGLPKHDTIIMKNEFAVAYNKEKMHPLWAFEVFGNEVNNRVANRHEFCFHDEPELGFKQITPEAIRHCGQQVGHLAAAANHQNSGPACRDTFSMCNVMPMYRLVNQGAFNGLECHVRYLASKGRKVFVVTGPVYSETSSSCYAAGGLTVLIPDAFFKVIVTQQGKECFRQCYLIPNKRPEKPTMFHDYGVTNEEIEAATGLKFFSEMQPKSLNEVRFFRCTYSQCLNTFADSKSLTEHKLSQHNDEKRLKCSDCDKSYTNLVALEQHYQAKHLKVRPYVCETCDKTFATRRYLTSHQISHMDEYQFECNICGTRCRSGGALNDHIVTHLNPKPYSCDLCGLSFVSKGNLWRHKNTHKPKKRYECALCSYSNSKLQRYNEHIEKVHSGQVSELCKLCQVAYVRFHRNCRVKKMKRKSKFGCIDCKAVFKSSQGLKIHVQIVHTGPPPFVCSFCKVAFRDRHTCVVLT